MGNRGILQLHFHDIVLGCICCFAYSIYNFACFTKTITHMTIAVTNNDQCCEIETTTTFYHFCGTADIYQLIFQIKF